MSNRLDIAWSWQFAPETLVNVTPVEPFDRITWEHACGGSTGKGVKIAVLDSGIDASHPVLQGRVKGYAQPILGPEGVTIDTAPHEDSCGHGTACAGIITMLAPECELYSVKVLGAGNIGRGQIFIEALRWAIENGMQVCNLSLGTTKKDVASFLHELADLAYFRGTMLITAANNLDIPSFPSLYASVISVAAHRSAESTQYYYNPTPPVDFGAPGIDVRVPWLSQGWIRASGNSFAAPHIAGLVTNILGKHPQLTPYQVKSILRALAANVGNTASLIPSDRPTANAE